MSTTALVCKWWGQAVMVIDRQRITRKSIVLAAANKDGGAHVDTSLSSEYEALAKDGAVGYFGHVSEGKENYKPIGSAHLVTLRQIGYEVLSSPEFIAYCHG